MISGPNEIEALRQMRARIWRTVRDLGWCGVAIADLPGRLTGLDPVLVDGQVEAMLASKHLALQGGLAGRVVVDEDCRVPHGESAHLGPGWEDTEAEALTTPAATVDSWRSVQPGTFALWRLVKDAGARGLTPKSISRLLNITANETARRVINLRHGGYVEQLGGRGSAYVAARTGRMPRFDAEVTAFTPELRRCQETGLTELRVTQFFGWQMTTALALQLVEAVEALGGAAAMRERVLALERLQAGGAGACSTGAPCEPE